MVNTVNFSLRGQDPLGLSDGEGEVGVSTTHKNTMEKIKKKLESGQGGAKSPPILIRKVEESSKKKRKLFFL